MDKYEADDPELLDWFETDDDGRLTLGRDWSNKNVKVCIVEVEEQDN